MPSRPPWSWGTSGRPKSIDELVMYLNDRLSDLEQWAEEVHREVTFGPVSGAPISVSLGRSRSGASLPTGNVDQYVFSYEMRPVQVSLVCFGGNLTVDILSESSSILSGGAVSLVGGTAQSFNAASDFATDQVTADLTLKVVSVDSGTPEHLRASVIGLDVTLIPE